MNTDAKCMPDIFNTCASTAVDARHAMDGRITAKHYLLVDFIIVISPTIRKYATCNSVICRRFVDRTTAECDKLLQH